ncbi:SMI1/KNR4 family protein [Massilia sp. CCM 9210]|uniref:SMI1/KNR4 family protein n=1 Tax=Massilia scottii TaxID=3057166 RepID=UPI002796A035|nr:SMI1/KNR4 family protein [Massilia sp. CCM 9210]MDQ1817403.1 SMI1/KNR4 family protein [Massilia sp. CCM 9210]
MIIEDASLRACEVIRKLEESWRGQQEISLQAPAEPSLIDAFEKSNRVVLPPDFLKYFQRANGFDQAAGYHDEQGFNFWPLEKLERIKDYDGGHYGFDGDVNYFIFCDYLDFCWAYAINLSSERNDVVLVGTEDSTPKFVSESFSGFIEAYLTDDISIYP